MSEKLKATGYVVRGRERIERGGLPAAEQKRLAQAWNAAAMHAAGYTTAGSVAE